MENVVGYICYVNYDNNLTQKIIPVELKESYELFLESIQRLPTEVEFNKWYLYNKID